MSNDNDKPPSTFRFIMIGTILLMLYVGIGMMTQETPPPVSEETNTSTNSIQVAPLAAPELSAQFIGNGTPTLLFLYASWCPYCREQFPIMGEIIAQYGNQVSIVIVSTDNDADDLAAFLTSKPQPLSFIPYIIPPSGGSAYMAMITQAGGTFRGGIPHSIIFDKEGNLSAELPGLTGKEAFDEALGEVL